MKSSLRLVGVLVAVAVMASAVYGGEDLQEKSMGKALLLSLLLPGTGQQYLGSHRRARTMWVAEGAIWTTYALFTVQGGNRRDKYEEMAQMFAGVDGVRDDTYYQVLAFYTTNYDYNIDVKRQARFIYPYDPYEQNVYFLENGLFGDDGWEWGSVEQQLDFRNTRTASKQSYRKATLTIGFAVLNRMVSMIDVYLTFKLSEDDRISSLPRLMVDQQYGEGFRVYLSTPF